MQDRERVGREAGPSAAADIQDRDGAGPLLKTSRRSFPFVELVFADAAYAGERVANATCITVQIVRKACDQIGSKAHKRRWVVERCFAWIRRNRRFSRDVERLIASSRGIPLCRLWRHSAASNGALLMRSEMASQRTASSAATKRAALSTPRPATLMRPDPAM